MTRTVLCTVISSVLITAHAEYGMQSDWSGGPGIQGPVISFGNEFSQGTDACYNVPFHLSLNPGRKYMIEDGQNYPRSVCSGDINEDGFNDVIGAVYFGEQGVYWWENADGTGTDWILHPVSTDFNNPLVTVSADINGDGHIDVLGLSPNSSRIIWWENDDGSGYSWTEHQISNAGAASAHCADINGDGFLDVLVGIPIPFAKLVVWYENDDGSGTSWTKHVIDDDLDYPYSVSSSDINGDGHMDVIGSSLFDSELYWWENSNGSGTSWEKHFVAGETNWSEVISADINGDCFNDIIGMTGDSIYVTWWENVDGSGTDWTKHLVDGDFRIVNSLCAEDMDGDGSEDLIGSSYNDGAICWWENSDGTGNNWIRHEVGCTSSGASSVQAAEIDSDGEIDILGGIGNQDEIAWWDLTEYPPAGSLESSILYVQGDPDWSWLDWVSISPPGTSVAMQVRASDDYRDMGNWSDTLACPSDLEGILTDNDSYFQYRAILQTSDPDTTPVLDEVTVYWDPLGIGESIGSIPTSTVLLSPSPNPSTGLPVLRFALNEHGSVGISIFDVSGRMVCDLPELNYPAGYHSLMIPDALSPGIYFCRMTVGDYSVIQSFVVIE